MGFLLRIILDTKKKHVKLDPLLHTAMLITLFRWRSIPSLLTVSENHCTILERFLCTMASCFLAKIFEQFNLLWENLHNNSNEIVQYAKEQICLSYVWYRLLNVPSPFYGEYFFSNGLTLDMFHVEIMTNVNEACLNVTCTTFAIHSHERPTKSPVIESVKTTSIWNESTEVLSRKQSTIRDVKIM